MQFLKKIPELKVWVLAPYLEEMGSELDYYFDYTQSFVEYVKVFRELGIDWQWTPVKLSDYRKVIDAIVEEKAFYFPLVLNLCDGDEVNGAPGVSIIQYLDQTGLAYTGADEHFFRITTSKVTMKQAFDKAGVPTAPWSIVSEDNSVSETLFEELGSPLLLKPAVSGGSMGLSLKNLVHNPAELREQAARIKQGYKGWKLSDDGLFVEAFINGPEFTVFISGSADDQDHVHIYPGLEASFHESLPEKERFLSFDRLWSVYEEESPLPEDEYFFHYIVPEEAMQQKLSSLALEAYRAVGGKGYCRVDIRMDKTTAKLYVLEVNAQCGISEDPDYSSIGDIIKVAGQPFCKLVEEILLDGLRRYELQNPPPNP